ncbi:MAG: glycine cleavage system protein GcvH [candidate division Zixibacteria bacterium]|nr:glycine cleavage system protein GcvH [candidate division Zixibacteria bacterium]
MNIPDDLLYTKEHEWVRVAGDVAEIGITDYAQGELGDVVFVELPETGKVVKQMSAFGTIEAVKAVSELFSPVSGTVSAVNGLIESDAGVINRDPYGDGWMIKVKLSAPAELNNLLKPDQYRKLLEG